jgi:hypothetical protein
MRNKEVIDALTVLALAYLHFPGAGVSLGFVHGAL